MIKGNKIIESYYDIDSTLKGVILLVLAVAGNFVAETLGCKTQKLLAENMYAKHFVIFFILYFAIEFTAGDKPQSPIHTFQLAALIYILFVLFTRMDIYFTIATFVLLVIAYINSSFIAYYKKVTPKEKQKKISIMETIQKYLYVIMCIGIMVGFSFYFIKQRREYSKTWSTTKFLFGVNKCKSMS